MASFGQSKRTGKLYSKRCPGCGMRHGWTDYKDDTVAWHDKCKEEADGDV